MVNTYNVLLTIHILAIITWLGGSMIFVILIHRARRSRDDPGKLAHLIREVSILGPRIFAPSSLVLIVTGLWMIYNHGWAYKVWVILALIGWGLTFITGNFFLGPATAKATEGLESKGADDRETLGYVDRVMTVARIDEIVLALIVIDMVIKPGT
jgi:uncharacterized membrane protein